MSARWPRPLFYLAIVVVLGLDQLTKALTMASFRPSETRAVLPGLFNLTYVQNTGIAFGMFKDQGLLVGLFVALFAVGAIYFTRGLNWAGWEPNLIGGSLVGGAVGNLLDRARLGFVVDFLDFHLGAYRWPVFNLADSAICVSVAWIVFRQLKAKN
jgi:signal peptidase II